MNDLTRPLPQTDEYDTESFWSATTEKALRYRQCANCHTIVFYPRRHCTGCTDGDLEWRSATGRGRIYTYSIVRQSYHPFFRNQVPYVVAWIELDEGPRLISNVIGVKDPGTQVHIDQRVQLVWEEHPTVNIPLFRLADDQAQ